MITGILSTDGGPHSASKWAEATSSHLVSAVEGVTGVKLESSIKLQAAVLDILTKGHTDVQNGERSRIASDPSVINGSLDASVHVSIPQLVTEIIGAGVGTPWEAAMSTPEYATYVSNVLYSHLHTSMDIERSWHADRNPSSPAALTFRAANPTPSVGV